MKLYYNNKAAISIAHNPTLNDRTKQIEKNRHFIKEKIASEMICTSFISFKLHQANVFTKGVLNPRFNSMINKLGTKDIFKPT